MKKFILHVFIVILCVFTLDYGVGRLFDWALSRIPDEGDPVAKSNYSLYRMNADIIITGSSRSAAAIDSRVILKHYPNYTVYNCSQPGQEFAFSNTLINCVLDRYVPRLIIWDFKENELSGENHSELSLLHPYYHKDKRIKEDLIKWEERYFKYEIYSNSFRYNKTGTRIFRAIFAPIETQKGMLGFEGTEGTKRNTLVPTDFIIQPDAPINYSKLELLKQTLQRADSLGCVVVITITPGFNDYNSNNVYAELINDICSETNAIFKDNSHLVDFVHKNELFHDNLHMNGDGATKYTTFLCDQLSSVLVESE